MTKIDQYITVSLLRNGSRYHAKLLTPLVLKSGHSAKIALCECNYRNDNEQFYNIEKSPNPSLEIAIPKYTKTDKVTVDFIPCRLEVGEYTAQSLSDDLNAEIKSKFPSQFNEDKCKIIYNKTINRFEIRIDGDVPGVSQEDAVTLLVYHPMSYYLGFANPNRPGTYVFVSK